ncbi:aminopeptidase N-like [Agrilus planipennis]|uniref:Aminopeptidase n=1 Tax=Agrilus planipennis TaxID=224129 RepID=A0A7F5R3U9_AGRPL|nr:aminopeptidase N-like [Agrilus planipennis]XP_025830381.1 aminopeptidase N-like [Agrilus planipennis]XP_025830382.1 aminopeptidase N-like [Agrilus planipennis]XP_025830383.1 aminopeptidase N-like [Agrilus planipennis]XP_025830384.1 aminopeptidase N-like [Agrilus planipennis]
MGKRSIAVTTSRSEFLPAEGENNEYERQGGCFVTTKRALLLVFLAIACFIVLALLMYYYGPNSKENEAVSSEKPDIENLINKSIESVTSDSLRLPSHVYPTFYKLRIQPYLKEEEPEKNFTFVGKVIIGIRCTKRTKTIVMNAGNIQIGHSDVRVYTKKILIKSLSQVKEAPSNMTTQEQQQENISDSSTAPTSAIPSTTQKPTEGVSTTSVITKESVNFTASSTTEDIPTSTSKEATTASPLSDNGLPTTLPSSATTPKSSTVASSTTEKSKQVNASSSSPVLSKGNIVEVPVEFIDNIPVSTKLVITVGQLLEVEVNYTIEIKFSGNISDHLVGLYKAPYIDSSGKERWIINTNFMPVYARNVFPCFDEPSLKTTFEISIARKENMTALSNMPLKETENKSEDGWVWDHFVKTPKMTTYSLAFSVGDLDNREVSRETPQFRIWAVDKLHESNYSAEMSVKALNYLEDYFGMKYPLPKLDFVVVPDLVEDAVESWGLVAFRDQALLVDPKSENWEIKSNILRNLAEPLSHQWFGKLVTMSNWSDFWLREGIGKFLAFGVVQSIDSEIGFLDTYVIDNIPILYADSLKTTKKLYYGIENIGQLKEMYNSGIVNKGTALLRMLNFTLSGSVFKKGTQDFIKKWSFESTSEEEYWNALDKIVSDQKILPENITVKAFMNSWTRQAGYPIVTINSINTSGQILLHQQRFVEGNTDSDNVWIIPLSYITKSNSTLGRVWLNGEKDKKVDIELSNSNDSWILFNADAGFYRVNYDNENWNKLLNQINSDPSEIPSSCRAQLLSDAFELAYKGIISYEIPLDFTKYLEKNERQFAPWEAAMRSFHNIEYIIRRSMHFGKLQVPL